MVIGCQYRATVQEAFAIGCAGGRHRAKHQEGLAMVDIVTVAFLGFRHMHMFEIYAQISRRKDMQIVAVCEEDSQTRNRLAGESEISVSHADFRKLLGSVDFDLLVVGEVFARRGALIRTALKAGKHVLSDKPICTNLQELAEIKALADRHSLVVAAALELRDSGAFLRTRQLIQSGAIGTVRTVNFCGQHPLLLDSRPGWYFDGVNHGGTINDLAIHAVDLLLWISGRGYTEALAARSWNAGLPAHHRFHNAAQLMLVQDGGCGVIGDVSYVSPDGLHYSLPQYWRFNFWGDRGMIESGLNLPKVQLYRSDADSVEEHEPLPDRSGGYLEDLHEAIRAGSGKPDASLFAATEVCLKAQAAADRGMIGIPLKD
jgi:predicted dehydrogenase